MAFKSVIIICFTIIYTGSIFHPVYSAAIAKLDETEADSADDWFIHNELDAVDVSDQQQQQQRQPQSQFDFRSVVADFNKKRKELLNSELKLSFGHDVKLNANELRANKIIMDAKEIELKNGLENPFHFNPSRHFFEVLNATKQSKLFKMIQKMPKGGILHIHEVCIFTFYVRNF